MKRTLLPLATCIILGAVACKREAPATSQDIKVERRQYEQKVGDGCDQPAGDEPRNCVQIELSWPEVTQGSDALKKAVDTWASAFLSGILSPESSEEEAAAISLEIAAKRFIADHEQFLTDAGESVMGYWTAESYDTVLLNDGKYLTLQLNSYVYAGGAHGNSYAAVSTFDAQTGKQLTWDDLVTDQAAVLALAEQKFREEQAEAFSDGFDFGDIFTFVLPASYGLAEDGIYFFYNPYEVAPYAMGSTPFTIPFSELGDLVKVKR